MGKESSPDFRRVNHFDFTLFQAHTHFEWDPSSSRKRDCHCGRREQSKGKRGEWRQGEFQHESKCCYHTSGPVWLIHLLDLSCSKEKTPWNWFTNLALYLRSVQNPVLWCLAVALCLSYFSCLRAEQALLIPLVPLTRESLTSCREKKNINENQGELEVSEKWIQVL